MKIKMYFLAWMVLSLTTMQIAFGQDSEPATTAPACNGYTLTQGAYANAKFGSNPNAGGRALANLSTAFPGGVTIGCAGGNSWNFSTVADIQNFLSSNKGNDVVYSQVLSLALNVGFDSPNLGNQTLVAGTVTFIDSNGSSKTVTVASNFNGWTVNQFLAEANNELGGCPSTYNNLADINSTADAINNNYDNGTQNLGILTCCQKINPTFTGVATATVECSSFNSQSFTTPTAKDYQGNTLTVTQSGNDVTTAGNCAGNYTVTRTWSATDKCGNAASFSETITVQDTTAPVLSGVPTDASASCDNVPAAAVVTASDNCTGATVTMTETRTDGKCAGNYTLTRTWTAVDGCGNSASQSQTITVTDSQAPTFSGVAADASVSCGNVPAAVAPTASDNCSGVASVTFSETRTDGNCAGNYTLTRTWTATDNCGNSATATQTITVTDKVAPTFSGVPADITASCSNIPASVAPTATDNCSGVTMSFNEVKSDVNCQGVYTITRTWTAVDGCGNSASASQIITVNEIACKYTTVTQGGWGANCSGGNWGCYLDKNFASNFPTGLTVGSVANGKYILLTSASAIHAFLPTGGTPSALTKYWQNPTKKSLPNTLAGQTVTLALNIKFFPTSATLVVLKGAFAGKTVQEILDIANQTLGGSTTYSASSVNDVANSININFDNGNGTNLGFLGYCVGSGSRDIAEAEVKTPAEEFVNMVTYPNPYVDRVKIEFSVKETSHVNLQLFNSNGASVGTLYNDVAEKGVTYSAEFVSGQPGMYIYRMSTARGVVTGKVIQIK